MQTKSHLSPFCRDATSVKTVSSPNFLQSCFGNYGGILLLAVALLMATLITGVMMGSSPSYTIDTPYYAYPCISRIH
ncbi:hypothetical protein OUZ56_021295 [Daphnia magna]|uniref:Uncharacterized protein n=1 Tax=Daphnia magna TaxID=35525 RepID=A0ABQ9ZGY9_9CRUS|nr:hypothetical protein OUZ56_021295 [Daphnia magna]